MNRRGAAALLGLLRSARRGVATALLVASALAGPAALGQSPEPQPSSGAVPAQSADSPPKDGAAPAQSADSPPNADKEAARAHFEKAVRLQGEGAWDPALAEYRESLTLYPTRAATKNAAICLQLLLRYDEALEMFVQLRDLPNVPESDKELAVQSIVRLNALLGTIEILKGPPGAKVTIDGRERGVLPLAEPLRVTAGTRTIRVEKEGFNPMERRLNVAGGTVKRLPVELTALATMGHVKVVSASASKVRVLIDNTVVGEAPWEGALNVGLHAIWLQGPGKLGTVPTPVRVKHDHNTVLTLAAKELPGWLRVEPTPSGATVLIDFVEVGQGIWEGRLPAGPHRVDVIAEGYNYDSRTTVLEGEERQVLSVQLERGNRQWNPGVATTVAPEWAQRVRIGASLGFAAAPVQFNKVGPECRLESTCMLSMLAGGVAVFDAGYEVRSSVFLGLSVGFLTMESQRSESGAELLTPVGKPPTPLEGKVKDTFSLSGALLGLFAAFRYEGALRVTGRLGAGFLLGSLNDTRSAFFTDSSGLRYPTGPVTVTQPIEYAYIGPEIRAGLRIRERVELNAGFQAFLMQALRRPRWDGERQVFAGNDGVGRYPGELLLGEQLTVFCPTIGLSYRF